MNIEEHNHHVLGVLDTMVKALNRSNSSKEKLENLNILKDAATPEELSIIRWGLCQTYSPDITFGVTSAAVKKYNKSNGNTLSMGDLMSRLANRDLTGHAALATICATVEPLSDDLKDIVYNMLDKNLKIRMDASSINKVFPGLITVFEVSLCNVYAERAHKVDFAKDTWFASRKLDGVRCLTIIYGDGTVRCFSRQGKEFATLQVVKDQIRKLGLTYTVLDGEMCIVDENGDEDFKSIAKEVTRKDHTIQNPKYKVFDMMTLHEFQTQSSERNFSERYKEMVRILSNGNNRLMMEEEDFTPRFEIVTMTRVENHEHFNELFNHVKAKGWEGLVIRKDDNVVCKRSDSMLKVKGFQDAEYVVEAVQTGPFRVIKDGREVEEEVMTNAYITHKGNRVSVGSGWSLEQRRQYKEHPEQLIGKTITVQYFEETKDKDANISLRFPTCKMVYENGRDC